MNLAADAIKVTEWWTAIVATIGVIATVTVGIAVALFANGYRMRVRAWRDPNEKVQVRAFNSGRIRGEVGPIEFVVRPWFAVRMLRRIARGLATEAVLTTVDEEVLKSAEPTAPQPIEPGRTFTWEFDVPTQTPEHTLPTLWHPLSPGPTRPIKSRQLLLRLDRGVYRPRYLRYVWWSHPFKRRVKRVPYALAEPPREQEPVGSSLTPTPVIIAPTTAPEGKFTSLACAITAGAVGILLGASLRSIMSHPGR